MSRRVASLTLEEIPPSLQMERCKTSLESDSSPQGLRDWFGLMRVIHTVKFSFAWLKVPVCIRAQEAEPHNQKASWK